MAYLFAGYTVLWTAIFLYLLTLHRRVGRLQREIMALERERPGAD